MSAEFVHLHLHTDYSMLDGACQIKQLAETAKAMGMPAMAVTDHGNMCGAVEFYTAMNGAEVKPIIGCEFYLAPGSRFEKTQSHPHHKGFHLLLLAADNEGYQNLCKLNRISYQEGYYSKPRIDKEVLAGHSRGVIATSTCIGGEIPTLLLENTRAKAETALGEYLDIFGKDNYYLELQDHGMSKQHEVNKALLELRDKFSLPLIATNDVHYLVKDHALPHELLLCIGTQKTMQDEKRLRFPAPEFYVKSPDQMQALFGELPDALRNTLEVAEKCNVTFDLNANHYPVYETPDGSNRRDYLLTQCKKGLIVRYGIDLDGIGYDKLVAEHRKIVDRMNYELDIIERMGFTSYFLVVWDFLYFARREQIPIGPGRGSGAGSIVAYLTHITDIEPLHYNLLFERFLNPERVSPPDFDIDLCERRRYEVINYVRDKYGADCVAQIGTFGTLKARAVIKDVARVMGRSFEEGNRITKLIPADPKMTLKKANAEIREIQEMRKSEPWVNELFLYSEALEGLSRNMSIHAAGVIIGDQPLDNLMPLAKGQGDEVITQFQAGPCEALGLLKMDFLGLRTLTIIQDTCDLIQKSQNIEIVASEIPLDDPKTYKLLQCGQTVCVFQLESSGMQDLCRRFGIDRIEHVIALIALYRPGPMQFLEEFIARKSGKTRVEYDCIEMKPILEETYGIMLYQEQVMQVVQAVAGFSLAQADLLRRAIGKKNEDEMKAQFERFIEGCVANGRSRSLATAIWEKIAMFAGYGFNKSHSAAYAFLACRTAYLKANYPVEFMAANLTSDMSSAERVALLISECREMGIKVLPPDVGTSDMDFTVDNGAIRFGLAAIKGVGEAAATAILKARQDGPFESVLEFCERVGTTLNRRLMESLTQCGAFDFCGHKRSQVYAIIDDVLRRAQTSIRDRDTGQANFFDLLTDENDSGGGIDVAIPDIPEWEPKQLLQKEKELLGFYVTGHPLDEYYDTIRTYQLTGTRMIGDMPNNQGVRIGGLISTMSLKYSKKDGRPWALITLEDLDSTIEVLIFSDAYAEYTANIVADQAVVVEGFVSNREDEDAKIIANKVLPLTSVPERFTREVHVRLNGNAGPGALQELKRLLESNPGSSRVILCVAYKDGHFAFIETPKEYHVQFSNGFAEAVRNLLGSDAVHVKPDTTLPVREKKRWQAANTA